MMPNLTDYYKLLMNIDEKSPQNASHKYGPNISTAYMYFIVLDHKFDAFWILNGVRKANFSEKSNN